MIHQLKLQKAFFEEKLAGRKPWELRFNDRGYKVGDYIGENEVVEEGGEWRETGRFVVEKITNIVYPEDTVGIEKGFVILSTVPCEVNSFRGECQISDFNFKDLVYGGDKVDTNTDGNKDRLEDI
jgi:ParB family chromosome partitioning protein